MPDPYSNDELETDGIHHSKPGIRVVPYSPPRLSDGNQRILSYDDEGDRSIVTGEPPVTPNSKYTSDDNEPNIIEFGSASPARTADSSSVTNEEYNQYQTSPTAATLSSRRSKRVINVHADKTFSILSPREDRQLGPPSASLTSTTSLNVYGESSAGAFSSSESLSYQTLDYEEYTPSPPNHYHNASRNLVPLKRRPPATTFVGGVRKVSSYDSVDDKHLGSETPSLSPITSRTTKIGVVTSPRFLVDSPSKSSNPNSVWSADVSTVNYPGIPEMAQREMDNVYSNTTATPSREGVRDSVVFSSSQQPGLSTDIRLHGQVRSDSDFGLSKPQETLNVYKGLGAAEFSDHYSQESLVVPPLRTSRCEPTTAIEVAKQTLAYKPETQEMLSYGGKWEENDPIPKNSDSQTSSRHITGQDFNRRSTLLYHRWVSPLSTIFSVSDKDGERLSQALSDMSTDMIGQRQSSITTVFDDPGLEDSVLERPKAIHESEMNKGRSKSPNEINDIDEHGDGLTDLRDLVPYRIHKTRFSTQISGHQPERDHGSASSMLTNTVNNWIIPAWARLYYGSGERRVLLHQVSYESMHSESQETVSVRSRLRRASSVEQCAAIFSAYRRPRDNIDVEKQQDRPEIKWVHAIKKQTSSIWSPHLRPDKRSKIGSIWGPPKSAFALSGNETGSRNLQILLFICGFILPPAWIVGALLPVPKDDADLVNEYPIRQQSGHSRTLQNTKALHEHIKWWRNLNRVMSIVGMLVICVFVILLVLGIKQPWSL